MDINKIITIIRTLKEEGVSLGSGQIAGTQEAGDDPPVRSKYIYGKGFRRNWLRRRTPPQ